MKNNKLEKFTKLEIKQMSNIKGGRPGSGQPSAAAKVRIRGNGSI